MSHIVAKALVMVGADMTSAVKDIKRGKQKVAGSMKSLTSSVAASLKHMTAALGMAGVAGAFILATREAIMFQKAMVDVRANARLMGDQGLASFGKLNQIARDLGRTTQFTAMEAANALNKMVLAGLSAAEAAAAVPSVLNLAAAANLELAHAAKIVVDNMRKYGLAASDTTKISDMLVSAQSRAQITASDLAQGLLTLGSISAAMNISFRDTVAVLTGMGRAGTEMSRAGTALAIALGRLARQPKEVADALDDMNININDFVLPSGAFEIIPLFRKIAETLPTTPVERGAQAMQLFGARGREILGVLNLMSRGHFIEKTAKGLEDDVGRAAKIAAAKMETFWGTLKKTKSALAEMAIAGLTPLMNLFNPFLLSLKDLIVVLSAVVGKISSFIKETLGASSFLKTFISVLAGLTAGYYLLLTGLKLVVWWQGSFLALSGPTGWAILTAGVIATGAAYVDLTSDIKTATEQLKEYLALEKERLDKKTEETPAGTKARKEAEKDAKLLDTMIQKQKSWEEARPEVEEAQAQAVPPPTMFEAFIAKLNAGPFDSPIRIERERVQLAKRVFEFKKEQRKKYMEKQAAPLKTIATSIISEADYEKTLLEQKKARLKNSLPYWYGQIADSIKMVINPATKLKDVLDDLSVSQIEALRNMEIRFNNLPANLERVKGIAVERLSYLAEQGKGTAGDQIIAENAKKIQKLMKDSQLKADIIKHFGSFENFITTQAELNKILPPTRQEGDKLKSQLDIYRRTGGFDAQSVKFLWDKSPFAKHGGIGEIRGAFGFAEYGRQIQDVFLRKEDPLLREAVKTNENSKKMVEELKDLNKQIPQITGLPGGPP